MKSTDVAVYVAGQFVRFVRPKQTASEVAGKVLRRTDRKIVDGGQEYREIRVAERKVIHGATAWEARYEMVLA